MKPKKISWSVNPPDLVFFEEFRRTAVAVPRAPLFSVIANIIGGNVVLGCDLLVTRIEKRYFYGRDKKHSVNRRESSCI